MRCPGLFPETLRHGEDHLRQREQGDDVGDDHEVVEHVRQLPDQIVGGQCSQKDISFHLSLTTQELPVYADKGRIQQVLYNLVDNAIKFSFPGSVIYLAASQHHQKVLVSVKDTGDGIPPESIDKRNRPWPFHHQRNHPGPQGTHQCGQHFRNRNRIYLFPVKAKTYLGSTRYHSSIETYKKC